MRISDWSSDVCSSDLSSEFRNEADADDAKAAQRVIRQWLAKKGLISPHLVIENGSGLSRAERVSARELGRLLQAAWRSPYSAEFISSMPLADVAGTMQIGGASCRGRVCK